MNEMNKSAFHVPNMIQEKKNEPHEMQSLTLYARLKPFIIISVQFLAADIDCWTCSTLMTCYVSKDVRATIAIWLLISIVCGFLIQIARRLLGKILIDLRNTREEAISVAELKSNQDHDSSSTKTENEDSEAKSKLLNKNGEMRKSSLNDVSMDQDDDDDKETKYRLDPK